MMLDKNWLENISLENIEVVFPDAFAGLWDEEDVYAAAKQAINEQQYDAMALYAFERALVMDVGKIGEDTYANRWAEEIEATLLMREIDEDLSGFILSQVMAQTEGLVQRYRHDPMQLEQLHAKLHAVIGYVGWILLGLDNANVTCEEGMQYYQQVQKTGKDLASRITEYHMLLDDTPGKPKVHSENIRLLHESSILDLARMLREQKESETVTELRRIAELEAGWYRYPDVDRCDKWLLLDAPIESQHHSILQATTVEIDKEKGELKNIPVSNVLQKAADRLESMRWRLMNEQELLQDPKSVPSRFWRFLLAALICGVVACIGLFPSEGFAKFFNEGSDYNVYIFIFGLPLLASLVAGEIKYGLRLCLYSFLIVSFLVDNSHFFIGDTAEMTNAQASVLGVGIPLAVCMLLFLRRTWSLRYTLRNTKGSREKLQSEVAAFYEQVVELEYCVDLLISNVRKYDEKKVEERYRSIREIARSGKNTAAVIRCSSEQ